MASLSRALAIAYISVVGFAAEACAGQFKIVDFTRSEKAVGTKRREASPFDRPFLAAPRVAGIAGAWNQSQATWQQCEIEMASAEMRMGIPSNLLRAIAITESGSHGRPNPFAMNIGGRAYSASSFQEMERVALSQASEHNVDVGCMQVSLNYHARKFADWRVLLQPKANIEYAASYLVSQRQRYGTWKQAVAAYHSRTPSKGARYKCKVGRNWAAIYQAQTAGCGPDIDAMSRLIGAKI